MGGGLNGQDATSGRIFVDRDGRVRRITPLEAERLMGFPAGWTDVPYRERTSSDGRRFRALGNSMAVPCMRWIGQRIKDA
jgi:DNA (cytosine-5)-methyltransferase 1